MTVPAIGLRVGLGVVLALVTTTACETTRAVAPAKTALLPSAPTAPPRAGSVKSVRAVGDGGAAKPFGDALVSLLVISGVLGALISDVPGPQRFGVATGVGGNDTVPGPTVSREYDVVVRFDDGGTRTFVYKDSSPPFRAGERVVMAANDLRAALD